MNSVNLKQARMRLGGLVEAAERGETVIITRRGRQVARLVAAQEKPLRGLPNLTKFRSSLAIKGRRLTNELLALRHEERH